MEKIAFQKISGVPVPYSLDDADKWATFKENQITVHKVAGTKKERSLKENNLFMACCQVVATNTEDKYWNDRHKAKFQCKVALHFVDPRYIAVCPDGTVQFSYKSLRFEDTDQYEAHMKFYKDAFGVLAAKIGLEDDDKSTAVEKLVAEAKSIMKKHYDRYLK